MTSTWHFIQNGFISQRISRMNLKCRLAWLWAVCVCGAVGQSEQDLKCFGAVGAGSAAQWGQLERETAVYRVRRMILVFEKERLDLFHRN